jgi:phage FluMu gp28-like protein
MALSASQEPILLPYQQRWLRDKSRFKIWLKARQIGASFGTAVEVMLDCLEHPDTTWVILSNTLANAKEFARHIRLHCQRVRAAVEEFEEFFRDTDFTQTRIQFSNGSRALALAATPDTARGWSGNVVLDEFAHHKAARDVYGAVFPMTTRGHRLVIISTPWAESGPFYELWTKQNNFSKHKTDIYQAVEEGFRVNIEELREAIVYEELWQSQYECKFISDASAWIPWEQISMAESDSATMDLPADWVPQGRLFAGADIARRRDLTVFWVLEKIGDVCWTRAVIRLRGASFAEQRATAEDLLDRLGVHRLCIDATGLGMQLAEELRQRFGWRVEPVTFTLQTKEALAVLTKRMFEERLLRIPSHREIRASLHAVRRMATATGHFRFDADRTEKGHADEFWALALALQATELPALLTEYRIAGTALAAAARSWSGNAAMMGY